jgi:hypothetical protein
MSARGALLASGWPSVVRGGSHRLVGGGWAALLTATLALALGCSEACSTQPKATGHYAARPHSASWVVPSMTNSRLAVSPPLNYADVSSMATNGHQAPHQ